MSSNSPQFIARPIIIRREFTDINGLDPNMDQDWYADMHRRRLQRLLSTSIFICFLVLFFDNKSGLTRRHSVRGQGISGNGIYHHDNTSQHYQDMVYLHELLEKEQNPQLETGLNISGIYSGLWEHVTKDDYVTEINSQPKQTIQPILNSLYHGRSHKSAISSVTKGSLWLFLQAKETAEPLLKDQIAYITGQAILHDEHSTFATTIFSVQGVLFQKTGKLTLYGNRPDSVVQLLYPKPDEGSHEVNASLEHGISQEHDAGHLVYDVSPPKFRSSRFRTGTSGLTELCFYQMDMHVDNIEQLMKKESKLKLKGVSSSDNCGLYMNVSATFEDEDLSNFYSKATHYAIVMTFISMGQIYLLLRQLQSSNTQATASKVSLLTIGQQAIIDSYLCLLHLTAGIIAQAIFTTFATVAFFKLIIFSIFEMRYLLLIWKARRPQSFAEGWITMRRELTILYSRFYGTLLLGILILYNGWNHINIIIFFAYSFWVPQIIHNVHREARNPLDHRYLFGMSFLRLLLPLYLYGCPDNFLSAFPMYQHHPNPSMCYVLVIWMSFQVSILVLQERLGPRFFIPARFLPVKYNYERRIDPTQLSLLRAQNADVIDCVICMNEVDIEARDYMIAPCDHVFHRQCLQEWMDIKFECPTCRSVLPAP